MNENPPIQPFSLERVQEIIHKRREHTLISLIVVPLLIVTLVFFNRKVSMVTAVVFVGMFELIFIPIFILNSTNYPTPKPTYKLWNKVLYIWGGRILFVFSVIRVISDLLGIVNPMHGFGSPNAESKPSLLLDATAATTGAIYTKNTLKPAAYIEGYFKQHATQEAQADRISYKTPTENN